MPRDQELCGSNPAAIVFSRIQLSAGSRVRTLCHRIDCSNVGTTIRTMKFRNKDSKEATTSGYLRP